MEGVSKRDTPPIELNIIKLSELDLTVVSSDLAHFLSFGAFSGAHLRAQAPRCHRRATAADSGNRVSVG